MIDFKKVSFNKAISLNPNRKIEIKSRWETKPLKKIVKNENDIQKGSTITKKQTIKGNIKVVAGGTTFAYYHNKANRPKNIITISASGANAGYINYWKEEIFASDCITIFIDDKITSLYVFYLLKIHQNILFDLARGSAQPHVYPNDIKNLKIPLPPLDIQEKIVKECEIVDNEVETAKKENEEVAKKREEIIGNINATMTKIGNIVDIYTGKRPKGGAVDSGVLSLGGEHIQNGKIDLSNKKYIPTNFIKNIPNAKIEKDDILMCKDGAKSGKVAFVDTTIEAYVNEHLFILRNQNKITNRYIFEFLFSTKGQKLLKNIVTGSAQGGINSTNLKNLQIPLPPLATQQQIVSQIEELENIINKNNQIINSSKQKKEEILKKYL
jgi:type I restriction enzyme M protein